MSTGISMKARIPVALVIILLLGLIMVVLLGLLVWQSLKTDYGVNVDSIRWLPSEARNITYLKTPGFYTIAEFEIAQEALVKWCTGVNMPLRKLGPTEEGTVPRCLHYLEKRGVIPVVPEPNSHESLNEWALWYQRRCQKSLSDADLYYEERWRNGGGYVIGYDVDEGRGYYWYGHH